MNQCTIIYLHSNECENKNHKLIYRNLGKKRKHKLRNYTESTLNHDSPLYFRMFEPAIELLLESPSKSGLSAVTAANHHL